MSNKHLIVSYMPPVATLTLKRPELMNALSEDRL
jgi:enoyl-CoA hydratase/carnithine racemase